jgi:hypothetical protein
VRSTIRAVNDSTSRMSWSVNVELRSVTDEVDCA